MCTRICLLSVCISKVFLGESIKRKKIDYNSQPIAGQCWGLVAGLASSSCWQALASWHSSSPASFLVNIIDSQCRMVKRCSHVAFSASPEPGPRPLKTEAEIEAGSEAFTNNNINIETVEKDQERGNVKGGKEDISEDPIDDEHQTCLSEQSQ